MKSLERWLQVISQDHLIQKDRDCVKNSNTKSKGDQRKCVIPVSRKVLEGLPEIGLET